MNNAIQNFQIPVANFSQAHRFYSDMMGYELQVMETPDFTLGIFHFDPGKGVGGCIIKSKDLQPSKMGTMVFLHTGQDLQPYLDRTKKAGGGIYTEKTQLGPGMGFYSIIDDTEGNRVGLYSDN